jgi:EAL domain-containing protein (putative c-di-GMP-specific phosphodiesterase class I)
MDAKDQKFKDKNLIPSYYELINEIKSSLINNFVLGALYINCSSLNKIEKLFGKKIYSDVLENIKGVIIDMKGREMRHDDIIASVAPEIDEFLVFLSGKRGDRPFYPTDIGSLCARVLESLNNSLFLVTFPYLKDRPKIVVGYAVALYNPLIQNERLINKLIEDAKLMSKYMEFRRLMRNKEKIQELIMKEEIRTLFQPIICFTDNKIIGYEALSRGPEGTEYENPYLLFDAAAEVELMFELDRLCKKKTLLNAKSISPEHKLFINCLPTIVHDPEFRDAYLDSFLRELNITPANIVLEITEREAIENYKLFKEAVLYYSGRGFAIAIDDTGTGYSGLETVAELRPNFIKLDISIIRDIDKNIPKQELIKAIMAFSKELNSTVIAEGIETEEELHILRELGINFGQGFLFARPGPTFPDINR